MTKDVKKASIKEEKKEKNIFFYNWATSIG
jgi:hypothetical protein